MEMAIATDMGLRVTSHRFACCCGKALTPPASHADRSLVYADFHDFRDFHGFLKAKTARSSVSDNRNRQHTKSCREHELAQFSQVLRLLVYANLVGEGQMQAE
jgi:hypothetical protein